MSRLSELLYLPLPSLPTASQKADSILIGANTANHVGEETDQNLPVSGGKWEDEEERRFFEDIQDLKDFVPKSVLGIEGNEKAEKEKEEEKERAQEETRKLVEELEHLGISDNSSRLGNGHTVEGVDEDDDKTSENE